MNARTNSHPLIQHPFPAFGTGAPATLQSGGLVLLPTANLWQVIAHGGHRSAVSRLLSLCPPSKQNRPELIFSDTEILRAWCPRVDPVLETLLHYHRRPLTLSVPAGPRVPIATVDDRGEVCVRIATDSACYRLCEDLDAPLVACLAMGAATTDYPTSFGRIRSDVLRSVEHIEKRRQLDLIGDMPAVTVRLDAAGELEFLRH